MTVFDLWSTIPDCLVYDQSSMTVFNFGQPSMTVLVYDQPSMSVCNFRSTIHGLIKIHGQPSMTV